MSADFKGRILVYSIVGCPHCMKAKSTLQELGLPYTDVSLDSYDDSVRQSVKDRTGKQTVPQIFFNAKHVGGNDDLQKLVADKEKLQEAIDDVRNNEVPSDAPQPPDPSLAKSDNSGDIEFTCELDECAALVRDLKASGLIKDHRKGLLFSHKNSFIGQEFVDWIVQTKQVDRERAVEMGQSILQRGFGHQLSGKTDGEVMFKDDNEVYRLIEDDPSAALNAGIVSECAPRPASTLSEDLRKLILSIYNEHLSKDGRAVDYKGIAENPKFETYIKATGELTRVDVQSATREEKLAFFINIYNALVIHATVKRGPPVNIWQRYKFFNYTSYIIGGHLYSLQDMENGVLRSNRRGVGALSRQFGSGDPRLKVMLEKHEPLIHFALVCGAKSCPPIKTYSAEIFQAENISFSAGKKWPVLGGDFVVCRYLTGKLVNPCNFHAWQADTLRIFRENLTFKGIYDQLKVAAEAFLESSDGCEVVMDRRQIKLSSILKWYREDFGGKNKEVVQWVYDHMGDGEKRTNLKTLLDSDNYRVDFMSYDWGLNTK